MRSDLKWQFTEKIFPKGEDPFLILKRGFAPHSWQSWKTLVVAGDFDIFSQLYGMAKTENFLGCELRFIALEKTA